MKTKKTMKALLAAGLISLGAALSAQAQTNATVYSVNAVGFVNLSIPAGFSMISNPLISTNNTLDSVVQAPPAGTIVYQWNGTSFDSATFRNGLWHYGGGAITLNPGQGIFINPPSPFTLTLVGEVPTAANSNFNVPAGFSIVGSAVPQTGGLDSLAFPIVHGDAIYQYVPGAGYTVFTYSAIGVWHPSVPTPAVGEAFWAFKLASATWTRNFSISQ